ncbi:YfiT family bacillithiol transferase [Fibrella sp. ES10-3-2-2]|nr:hypothetical protein A6C57_01660 [Fibrella sp. ES10-3-2-2]
MQPDESRQFPIDRWSGQLTFTSDEVKERIQQLNELPAMYRALTELLSDEALQRTYRPGSWTVRQLVHHVADTHQWHYFRIKHALTVSETQPGIFSDVTGWANQPDGKSLPVAASLAIIEGLHQRLAYLYEHLAAADLEKAYYHPFRQINVTLAQAIDMVVWHGKHHLAHIRLALN